jgi:hypothetical protein
MSNIESGKPARCVELVTGERLTGTVLLSDEESRAQIFSFADFFHIKGEQPVFLQTETNEIVSLHSNIRRRTRAIEQVFEICFLLAVSREPLTEAEMVHFNSDAVGLGEFFGKFEHVVKAYAREHTRKSVDVSLRLNAEGHRTAAGEFWTPRLVRFLLALMFDDSPKPGGTSGARPEVSPPRRAAAPGPTIVSMDDKGEIARRLSSLGRVTMKPKRL